MVSWIKAEIDGSKKKTGFNRFSKMAQTVDPCNNVHPSTLAFLVSVYKQVHPPACSLILSENFS